MKRRLLKRALRLLLRLLALGCVLGTLGWQSWRLAHADPASFPRLHALPYGLPLTTPLAFHLALLGAAAAAILFTFALLMPSAVTHFIRCPDVLVPMGFLTPFGTLLMPRVIGALARLGLTEQRGEFALTGIALVLATFFAAWTTRLVLSAAHRKHADALSALRDLPLSFLRLFPLILMGWGMVQIGADLCSRLLFDISPLATALVGVLGTVCWNMATSALLPIALNPKLDFVKAVSTGFEISVLGLGRWLLPLLAQMALLGMATCVFVSQSASLSPQPDWHVHVFWTGGYESLDRWYPDIARAIGAPILPLFQTALFLLFGLLALGIKLIIVERMNPLRTYRHKEVPDPFADELEWEEE